jgi:tRNA uridine 5-carbamoylmethylation protein Kti12
VFFCDTKVDFARENNQKNANKFTEEQFDDFRGRMELPNLKNRWDNPLFDIRDSEPTPLE